MAVDLISKKTRYEFREHFVGSTLREIEAEFDAADIACDNTYNPELSGQRRSLVEQYYHTLDFSKWSDVRRLLGVYESALLQLEQTASDPGNTYFSYARKHLDLLIKLLKRDGFGWSAGRITRTVGRSHLSDVIETTAHLDAPELQRQLDRIRQAVDDDPSLAIGTAKELVETVCKTILHERSVEFDPALDIQDLVKLVRKVLGLLPEDVPQAARGADTIRKLLSNLGTIAHGLGELRNLYGTGHGRAGPSRGLSARHARLAVGAASTLTVFLLETHAERLKKGDGSGP